MESTGLSVMHVYLHWILSTSGMTRYPLAPTSTLGRLRWPHPSSSSARV